MSSFSGTVPLQTAAVAALAVAAIAVCAGCMSGVPAAPGGAASFTIPPTDADASSESNPLLAPSTLPPDLAGTNRSDASAVAAAVVRIWFSADTRVDSSPHDARLRACPLLVAPYCLAIRDFPPMAGPGADWLALTAQQVVIAVGGADVRPAAEVGPPDSATSAERLLEVTEHLMAPNGSLPDRRIVVAVSLTRDHEQWKVAEVTTR